MAWRPLMLVIVVIGCGSKNEPSQPSPADEPNAIETRPAAPPPLPALAPNAPADQPVVRRGAALTEQERAIAPLIEQAREAYPGAKRRYLAGLANGEHLFVVTKLHSPGRQESAYIAVSAINDTTIMGTIATELTRVQGFTTGQAYSLTEDALEDWMIAKPDGSEEGNLIGKYIDAHH